MQSCDVTVLEVLNIEGKSGVRLDKTIFYPEGGGQPHDHGKIEDAVVYDVQNIGGDIIHFFSGSLYPNTNYEAKLDWNRRFLFMQLHSGQHLMSAFAKSMFDATTVGFHIGADYITIDLDRQLSAQEVQEVESKANEAIYNNLEILGFFPSEEQMDELELRKYPKVEKDIRVVQIEGVDCVPCGGTHVKSTGEIGIVKVKSFWKYKSGIRIEFVAGSLALEDYRSKTDIVNSLINQFSVKEEGILAFAKKMEENLKAQSLRITDMKKSMMDIEAEILSKDMGDIIYKYYESYDMNDFRHLSKKFAGSGSLRVFSTFDKGKGRYGVFMEVDENDELSLSEAMKAISAQYKAKGGGSKTSWQGTFPDLESVENAVNNLRKGD